MSGCPTIINAQFDQVVKVVTSRFPLDKVRFPPFQLGIILWCDNLVPYKHINDSNIIYQNHFSIGG